MGNREYNAELRSFNSALELLTSSIKTLNKSPFEVPEVAEGDDDSKKRDALLLMLESLAGSDTCSTLSSNDIDRASDFFMKLYGGREQYRHRYADVCEFIFSEIDKSHGELDDGVPYSVNCLAENIRIIYEHLLAKGGSAQAKCVLKLADHIDLEKTRLSHYIEQQKTMRDFREAISKTNEERAELEREFAERLDRTKMEYVAVLGVFAAIVLAFNGGVGFSTSALGALGIDSGIRALVFQSALVEFVLVNTICILLVFVWKMSFSHQALELGNRLRNTLIVTNAVLVLIMLATVALSHPLIRKLVGL